MTSLRAGDIVWVDFDPVKGTEQSGVRPAIVLSSSAFHYAGLTAIVCPITRNLSPWPTKVYLPEGMKTRGCVIAEQIRTVYRSDRGLRFIEHAPEALLADVRAVLGELLGISR
jgi:mRNA interferase MazF